MNGICSCDIGFTYNNACELLPFYADLAVNTDNSLNLTFSDDLANIINKYDLGIQVQNVSSVDLT